MKQLLLVALCIALLGAGGCGGKATGGGWVPSADLNPDHKASFGFNYKCDDTEHTLTGHLTYHDHGTGHRLAAPINNLVYDSDGNALGCGESTQVGVSGACAVVKSGGGGVHKGDLVLVSTQDGNVVDPASSDVAQLLIVHPDAPLSPNAPLALAECATLLTLYAPYYLNQGELRGGNLTWYPDE